eukprot:IDg14079t1
MAANNTIANGGSDDYPFRQLCASYGAALYVSEMVHAASVLSEDGDRRCRFGDDESVRSAQLYGTDAGQMGAAAAKLIATQNVRHIDINMGCPAKKVLRAGGGAALTRDPALVRSIVSAVAAEAAPHGVAVSAKLRLGVSWSELTYPAAARAARDGGAHAITLHARVAEDGYEDGAAKRAWAHIRALSEAMDIPVLGNGDVYTAIDALKMMSATGCAGISIGRGCLGRPWLFGDLKRAMDDGWAAETTVPSFGYVMRTCERHVRKVWTGTWRSAWTKLRHCVRCGNGIRGISKLITSCRTRLCRDCAGRRACGTWSLSWVKSMWRMWDILIARAWGAKGKMGYLEQPQKHVYEFEDKRKRGKSASQRGPVTMRGHIQKELRMHWKKAKDIEKDVEKREKARLKFEESRIMLLAAVIRSCDDMNGRGHAHVQYARNRWGGVAASTSARGVLAVLKKMGRTLREESKEDGTITFVLERAHHHQMRSICIALFGGGVIYVVALLVYLASRSIFAVLILAAGLCTHIWLTYTLCVRRVRVSLTAENMEHVAYVGRRRVKRSEICGVEVRVKVPDGRTHVARDEKYYLAVQ